MTAKEKRPVAVALDYDGTGAPTVSAKGQGEIARQILEAARKHGVPVEEDAALAEALSQVELEAEIPVELYKAVAAVIAFTLRAAESLPRRD